MLKFIVKLKSVQLPKEILPSTPSTFKNLSELAELAGYKLQSIVKQAKELILTLVCGKEVICITAFSISDAFVQIEALV